MTDTESPPLVLPAAPAVAGAIVLSPAELERIIDICARAAEGDLEARIVGLDPAQEISRLYVAINRMLDIADSFVRESAAAMEECSRERFHRPI